MTHTAEIRDVFADARQVTAREIRTGDYVFTTTGQRREVTRIRARGQVITFTRSDGAVWTWRADDVVTVVPVNTAGTWACGVPMGSRRRGETLPAYMYRHAFTWAATSARVPDDLAADYAAWCRDAVTRDAAAFDYWNHRTEYPVWLDSAEVTR